MKPLIFSVEDDVNIQNVIQIALTNSDFDIRIFSHAKDLFLELEKVVPDLILLDVMLPDVNGIETFKRIKTEKKLIKVPIMIVSAKISEIDKVIGLDSGADDYLIKPFGVLELISRVKALIRRTHLENKKEILIIENLKVNPANYLCEYLGKEIKLTKKQFELLYILMSNRGKTITRDDIINSVWGFEFIGETRTLDVHIKEIRKKLDFAGINTKAIDTVRGIGYRFIL